jgi:hypothetical protein
MNASDIIKMRQNKVQFEAYYRPTIFPGTSNTGVNTLVTSSINIEPYSSISSIGTSYTSTIAQNYLYTCNKPIISYELANNINNGKYECEYPYCSSLSIWSNNQTIPIGTCNCKISELSWENNTPTTILSFSSIISTTPSLSTFVSTVMITSTNILTGPEPIICPSIEFYQGPRQTKNI